ncbi:hypothetical protein BACERE00184_00564 [Bacillus cereus]|nr:hypothetical protein BACERE00184_00564 [Bacillus cereus]
MMIVQSINIIVIVGNTNIMMIVQSIDIIVIVGNTNIMMIVQSIDTIAIVGSINIIVIENIGKIVYDFLLPMGVASHAHQLKNENKMNFRSNKLKNT